MNIKKDCRQKEKVLYLKEKKEENMHENKIQLHRKM